VRYKGTKYKDEILRALQGIDQAEEQERAKEGLERSVEYKDYVWKRKESHDVSDLLCFTSHLTYYNVTILLFYYYSLKLRVVLSATSTLFCLEA
jgi:hypothetical protein